MRELLDQDLVSLHSRCQPRGTGPDSRTWHTADNKRKSKERYFAVKSVEPVSFGAAI